MGCNAWNHPPNCSCGWGGGWHGSNSGEDSWIFNKHKRERSLGYQKATTGTLACGYTDTNASCPVCGAAVYFYESPYGGRVFFDELGPPWPTHSCTTNRVNTSQSKSLPWYEREWSALSSVNIVAVQPDKGLYSIEGSHDESPRQFYFLSKKNVVADIVRYQRTEQLGVFLLSILYYDPPTISWSVIDIVAYTSSDAALEKNQFAACSQSFGNKQTKPIDSQTKPTDTQKYSSQVRLERSAQARLEKIEDAAIKLFKGDITKANKWMTTPSKHLSRLLPASRVKSNRQLKVVLELIKRLQEHEVF